MFNFFFNIIIDSLSYFNFINIKNNYILEDIIIMEKMTEEIIEEIIDEVPINYLDNSLFKEIIFQNNVPWGLYFLNGSRSNIAIFLFLSLNLTTEPVDYNISCVIPEIISEMMEEIPFVAGPIIEEDELWASSIIEEVIPAVSSIIEEEATPAMSPEIQSIILEDIKEKFKLLSGSSNSFMEFAMKFRFLTHVDQQRYFYNQALLQIDYILPNFNTFKEIIEFYLEDFGSPSDSYVIKVLESQISKLTTTKFYLNELLRLSNDLSTIAKCEQYNKICIEFDANLSTTDANFFLINSLVSNFISLQ